jgi:hypothetical protein
MGIGEEAASGSRCRAGAPVRFRVWEWGTRADRGIYRPDGLSGSYH